MKKTIILLLSSVALAAAVEPPKAFQANCVACHQLDNSQEPIVGPSVLEMNHIYQNDQAGFIKWCIEPVKKRENTIDMPSMAHVPEADLIAIHAWIVKVSQGKKFNAKGVERPTPEWEIIKKDTTPRVQRIFLEDASPAAIAVTVDGDHSLCWDAMSCRVRHIWHGGFIDGNPYWRGNGGSVANVIGEIYYRAPKEQPAGIEIGGKFHQPKFRGYQLIQGVPEFEYKLGDVIVSEKIANNAGAVQISIKMVGVKENVRYPLGDTKEAEFTYSAGKIVSDALELTPAEAENFQISFTPK